MAGFDNDVMYASNVDFTGGSPVTGKVTTNGQLLIGSTASPNIRVGTLASAGGTITITVGAGTIDLATSGSAVGSTITGNSGGAISPSSGNWNLLTANTTVKFVGAGSTLTEDFGLSNLLIGSPGSSITSASLNAAVGNLALDALSTGASNSALGNSAGRFLDTASYNVFVGYAANGGATPGSFNTIVGGNAYNSGTGSNNVCIGYTAGSATPGSSNIMIANNGSAGESNTIRIGTQGTGTGQQNLCYLAGVLNTVSGRVINVTTPGAYPYTTLITDHLILVDTSSARTITPMAAPVTGTLYIIKDNTGSAAANNITITPSGKNIDGAASSTMNINFGSVTIVYNGTQWNIV